MPAPSPGARLIGYHGIHAEHTFMLFCRADVFTEFLKDL